MKTKQIIYLSLIILLVTTCFSNAPEIHSNNLNYLKQIQYIRSNNLFFKIPLLLFVFLLCLFFLKKNNLFGKIKFSFFIKSLLFFKSYVFIKILLFFNFEGFYQLIITFFTCFIFTSIFYIFSKKEILKIILFSGIVFLTINFILIEDNLSIMFISGRYVSITGNSNHAALAIILFTPPFLLNIINNNNKLLNLILLSCFVILLFMTGSRTGLLVFLIFLFSFYPNKVKSFFVFGFLFLFYYVFDKFYLNKIDFNYTSVFDRLSLNSSNRELNWLESFDSFLNNPLFGRVLDTSKFNVIENSYLACLSNYGLIGFIFFFSGIIYLLKNVFNSIRSKDLLTSCSSSIVLALLLGAYFEGYLLANVSITFTFLLIYSNIIYFNKKLLTP